MPLDMVLASVMKWVSERTDLAGGSSGSSQNVNILCSSHRRCAELSSNIAESAGSYCAGQHL